MSNTKHTSIPWRASNNTGPTMQGYSQSSCVTGTGEDRLKLIAGCFNDIGGAGVAAANAAFIVRAVNSHQILVDGLKAALENGELGDWQSARRAINEALAAAEVV